jgi:hypothetical protein
MVFYNKELAMIDISKEIEMHVGDRVSIGTKSWQEGSVESIRIISEGRLVENFKGKPDRIVVTVHFGDSVVNKRGFEVTPLS